MKKRIAAFLMVLVVAVMVVLPVSAADDRTVIQDNITISKADTTYQNATIKGNVTISNKVTKGTTTFDNVIITGKLVIQGRGDYVLNNVDCEEVIIENRAGSANVTVSGASEIDKVYIRGNSKLEEKNIASGYNGFAYGYYNKAVDYTLTNVHFISLTKDKYTIRSTSSTGIYFVSASSSGDDSGSYERPSYDIDVQPPLTEEGGSIGDSGDSGSGSVDIGGGLTS